MKSVVEHTPLVSILVPAYNAEAWIADALESALSQTWRNKEVIVVDDGSCDDTVRIARSYEAKNVKVIEQENAGACAARNSAYAICQGAYIQWLDADDLLEPDKIELQLAAAKEEGEDGRMLLSSEWGRFMYRTRKARFVPSELWEDLSAEEWLLRKWESRAHMLVHGWLVSRELSERAGLWNTSLSLDDDGEYFCRVVAESNFVKFVSGARVLYRTANFGSMSNSWKDDGKLDSLFLSIRLQIERVLSLRDDCRSRAACINFLEKYLFDFSPERPDLVGKVKSLGEQLGGELGDPVSPWKYRIVHSLLGWPASKRLQTELPMIKNRVCKVWDRFLYGFENKAG